VPSLCILLKAWFHGLRTVEERCLCVFQNENQLTTPEMSQSTWSHHNNDGEV